MFVAIFNVYSIFSNVYTHLHNEFTNLHFVIIILFYMSINPNDTFVICHIFVYIL